MTEKDDTLKSKSSRGLAFAGTCDLTFGAMLVMFFGSGCAALIYEIVWLQQLQLIIGSSAISVGLLLATYMGGLFLGSIALPRLASIKHHPFRLYGMIELGIAGSGVLIFFGLPSVASLYVSWANEGFPNLVFRGITSAACLLPPTVLMGATFPALSRWMEPTQAGISRVGILYGANIAGAVFGCLWAGFYLLRIHNLAVATYAAVAINICVGLAGLGLGLRNTYRASTRDFVHKRGPTVSRAGVIYVGIALSGLSALGAEVVWTRLLSVLFGMTVYTFSIILAVFLTGIGIGSGLGSIFARSTQRPRLAFAICQLMLAASIAWTASVIAKSLPYWPVDPALAVSPWFNFQLDVFRSLWTILPGTFLWGASFPLALAPLPNPDQDTGSLAARIYGANTLGAVIGSAAFTFVFVPRFGTLRSEQILITIPCVAVLVVLISLYVPSTREPHQEVSPPRRSPLLFGISIVAILALIGTLPDIPWQVMAYGRRVALMSYTDRKEDETHPIQVLYRGEGLNSSVVITEQSGLRIIYVNGNVEASNAADDLRLERMAGHIPALVHANSRDVLVIGFGAGITAGSFVTHPEVKKIVVAELESLIPSISGKFFGRENYGVLKDARTKIVYDDGRHYLQTHRRETFDIITSDPVHLWVRGTSALYSKEYFEIVRSHLNPGGVMAQWLPLYDGDTETIKTVMATFFEVFPNGTIWSNHIGDRGYDLVLLGQAAPMKIDLDYLQDRLERPENSVVFDSLREVGFKSAVDISAAYLGQAADLKSWLSSAQINLDGNLRLQYIAGFEMNSSASEKIYQFLLTQRRFSEPIFVGSDKYMQPLRSLLNSSR